MILANTVGACGEQTPEEEMREMKSCKHSTTLVLRMTGTAAEVFRLFALYVRERGNVSITEVK